MAVSALTFQVRSSSRPGAPRAAQVTPGDTCLFLFLSHTLPVNGRSPQTQGWGRGTSGEITRCLSGPPPAQPSA